MKNFEKYKSYQTMNMPNRKWPNNVITKAPIWCSVDLRDGNQALEIPMNLDQKIEFFKFLVGLGFKEIEVGFPAASDTEYQFTRALIENNLIPDDVTIQVLTQSRQHIIEKTFEALRGVKRAIVHLYNSTSTLQRDVVFNKSKEEIIELAVFGAKLVKQYAESENPEAYYFEYSPESFTGTEMDYAVEISNAVMDIWKPTADKKAILNLPSTVEMSTPNVYADQIEYVCQHLKNRENILISLHAHNDRGCAVAASELGMMAGADRVEGTLFGNGERTGNADILTIGMNLFSQGIDPELDFSHINDIIEIYEASTQMEVAKRHPYAGDLVYTAFSGSHQDAIKKGMDRYTIQSSKYWEIPYLPIDPMDVGRDYAPIIRINSQSGKGGVAYILETEYGLKVPKVMQQDFSTVITKLSDKTHSELSPMVIYEAFKQEYVNIEQPLKLISYKSFEAQEEEFVTVHAVISLNGEEVKIQGDGNGPLDALSNALKQHLDIWFEFIAYDEHSLDRGSQSRAIAYIQIHDKYDNNYLGAGVDRNINTASMKALVSVVNKKLTRQ
jgi:2-isopropylmalate synthase